MVGLLFYVGVTQVPALGAAAADKGGPNQKTILSRGDQRPRSRCL